MNPKRTRLIVDKNPHRMHATNPQALTMNRQQLQRLGVLKALFGSMLGAVCHG